ncbi:hypothetical protein MIMGU_mgv1a003756mg [Erythranthe guttata]|uniref:Calmodulin-binding domain-containing protein n=1 Tax=Erythranthe guttata TaxID=4155 RepID=A0A022Q360_ERYGU|nr:hypothetical protein MIMGU_mgv1a003756mg [Erythranthe guttata]
MTSRTRESGPPGKEKRGTSPSYLPNTTQTKRSPNPSKNNSPAKTHDSTTSEKPVPNYLKPTLSSGNDFVSKQQGKKPFLSATSDSTNKASLTRRRSFDKPPSSSSQTQKSRVSPSPTLRSSSFSAKSTTASSQRGVLEKNSKQHGLYARPVNTTSKKGGVIVKKQEAAAKEQVVTSPTDKVDNLDLLNVPEPETLSKDQESGTDEAEDEKSVKIGSVDQKGSNNLVMEEDLEPVSIEQSEGESEKDDKDAVIVTANSPTDIKYEDSSKIVAESKIVTVESPTDQKHEDSKITTVDSPTDIEHVESPTVLENQDVSPGVKTDDPEIESQTEEISSKQEEVKEHSVDESNNINSTDESVAGNPNEETEEKKKQQEEEAKAVALNEKEAEASRIESHESKQTEVQEEAVVQENVKEAESHESKQTEVEEEAVVQEKPKEAEDTEFETKQAEVEEEAVVQEKVKEAEASEVETKQAEVEEAVVQEKPKEAEASEVETKQAEVQEVVVQEKLKAVENQGPKVQVMAHGKKECGVSNDHIEETASRLREQRKNRVKALAGAFESVISLQETK